MLHTDHCAKKLLPWVDGVIAAGEAYFERNGEPLFSSHMLDLSEEPLAENLEISRGYLSADRRDGHDPRDRARRHGRRRGRRRQLRRRATPKLYTTPEDVLAAYDALRPVGSFTVAASFGNTHGVYAPGNVKLTPAILKDVAGRSSQERAQAPAPKPVDFVFHGGSGSTPEEIREAVSYGVVKMNIDTDTQWAFTQPIKQYMDDKGAYLQAQLGNPEGPTKPNKKQIDPRNWVHVGEQGMVTARLIEAFRDLGSFGQFTFT